MSPTPLAVFIASIGIAWVILAAVRSNFMRGRNRAKKQNDVVLLIFLTLIVWSLIPLGK
jgi:hypothetical protein